MLPNHDRIVRAIGKWAATLMLGAAMASAGMDAERRMEEGIHREVVLGDLRGAMELYGAIVADASAPRGVAARALLRTGQCLEKLGQSEEAYVRYERLVRDFGDEAAEASAARVKLATWSKPTNLRFEEGAVGKAPPGWLAPGLPEDAGRLAELHRDGCRSRVGCAVVMAATNGPRAEGTLMQKFGAAAYRGKTVRLSAWLKLESVFPAGPSGMRFPTGDDRAQLWLKVVRANRRAGFAESMDDRPVRTAEWTRCEITGTIDEDAEFINFGVLAIGGGRAWVDEVAFEVVK